MAEAAISWDSLGRYASLKTLAAAQCDATPRHQNFLWRRFSAASEADLRLADELSMRILRLAGEELPEFLKGYDFICEIMKAEEIYFRRNNAYRVKTAQEAFERVYSDAAYMQAYMRGLLMSQVFWSNHTASLAFFIEHYLAGNPAGYSHLEIGPGHGLLLERAITDSRAGSVTAWDISPASIVETGAALEKLGVKGKAKLKVNDLFSIGDGEEQFDGVVLSEVLEHLEDPLRALHSVRGIMRPGGRLYVNVPLNSPAPDHIFLLRTPEEAVALVEDGGFNVERMASYPATNYTIEAARKHALTMSVCIAAVKPGQK